MRIKGDKLAMKTYKKVIHIFGLLFIMFAPNWVAGSKYAGSNLIYYLGFMVVITFIIVDCVLK